MREEWRAVLQFPGYSVSNAGRVRNEVTDRYMTLHTNQGGIVNVSFNQRGKQFKRSVAVLVATAFVTMARARSFDTPINLDGDRSNNRADNLLWRPRWYATEYFRQFSVVDRLSIDQPVEELKSGEIFKSSWQAAIEYGLLDAEVVASIMYRTYARPTFQRFRIHS